MKIIYFLRNIQLLLPILFLATFFQISCKSKSTPIPAYNSNALFDSTFNQQWHSLPDFIAGQQAFSIHFQNNKTLWVYAQSHINDKVLDQVPCDANVQNAGVLQNGNTFQLLNTGNTNFVPDVNGKNFIPMSSYYYQDSIFIFGKANAADNLLYVATFLYPSMQFIDVHLIPQQILVKNNFQYGFANASDSVVGYTYNYGIKNTNGIFEVAVARHSLDNPNKPWKYWNGANWKENADEASTIFSSTSEPTCIRKLNGAYICLIQSTGISCGSGATITFKYSPNANGPFDGKSVLFSVPNSWQNFAANSFAACIQPSIIGTTADKRVLITYSLKGYNACTNDCNAGFTNPDFYSTYGFTVPLNAFNPVW